MIIGLDVGGTHTDVVLLGDEGVLRDIKVATDASDLFRTVLSGIEQVTAGIEPTDIRRAVLSTTLTTNAIVQRKLAPVAMIVCGGPGINARAYQTNPDFFQVAGYIDHRGREIQPIAADEIRSIAARLQQEGLGYVGVVGKFSVRNPSHELRIAELLAGKVERVFLGHRISGNLNYPRRIATTYLNAAVYPLHKQFFEAVRMSLEQKGLQVPIHLLKADGGTMLLDASVDFPSQTILSGPAASIMGSVALAPEHEESIVLDIGGTTTDMALLVDRVPLLDPSGIQLGPYKTLIRALDTQSIGVGGDSLITVSNGLLRVGPERKGPAMAYGGPAPTPTDALSVLGHIKDGDRQAAVRGFTPVAHALNLSVQAAAREAFDQACRQILAEARQMVARINRKPVYTVHEVYQNRQFQPRIMLLLGGPAPHFAKRLEELSDFKVGVVPRWRVANAIGAALARTTCEVTLFADTEQGLALAPEESYRRAVDGSYSREAALKTAYDLLAQKALQQGANSEDLAMEVLEELQFSMVRGFYTSGKNIRLRVQVQPGLINAYDVVAGILATAE